MRLSCAFRASRSSLWVAILVAGLALSLSSCGGKKRPPPLPPPGKTTQQRRPPQPQKKPPTKPVEPLKPIAVAPTIRLLLKESFQAVTIRGSSLAPLVTARVSGRAITLRKGADVTGEILGSGTGFKLTPARSDPLLLDGVPYRGDIEVFINPLSAPVVVNELDLEDYLRGAVPNELHPSRFPEMEALKAQAVAARTFAEHHRGTFVKRGFDLYSDERSQVYSGVRVEHPVADQAIVETRGVVATHNGLPILSVYSSTCGGATESYGAIFRRDLPYLKGGAKCSDQMSPFHSWETTAPASRIEANLNRRVQFGRLRGLETVRRGVSGRIVEMRMKGSKDERLLRGNDVRWALGLKSSLIDEIKPHKDDDGNVKDVSFKGRGWGHGVGLCQYGAVAMARDGASYEKILKHYYNDIGLKRIH